MNKKQPFYKTGSPLNQFPDPIQLLRTKFVGETIKLPPNFTRLVSE